MVNRSKSAGIWFFLFGLGSQMQLIASLSFTELAVLIMGPFMILTRYRQLKRDGVTPFLWVSVLMLIGCIASSIYNRTPLAFAMRGTAAVSVVVCTIPVAHALFRKDMNGFRWAVLGSAISLVLCTFIFRKSVDISRMGDSVEALVSGPLYWIQRVGSFVNVPALGWYMRVPLAYSIAAPVFMAFFALLTSASGRAVALYSFAGAAMCVVAGKSQQKMRRICKYFWYFVLAAALVLPLVNLGYRYAALSGFLGEKSRAKYEMQTAAGTSIGKLLLSGRLESFVGLLACRDQPIMGFGPWARDANDYTTEFLIKYGTYEDVAKRAGLAEFYCRLGLSQADFLIPCHSHITELWLWYGLPGLIFALYLIFVMLRYLRQDCYAVPHLFVYLACTVPTMLWHVFFSPFAARTGVPFFIVGCLMVRAVRTGKFSLPRSMIEDIILENKK